MPGDEKVDAGLFKRFGEHLAAMGGAVPVARVIMRDMHHHHPELRFLKRRAGHDLLQGFCLLATVFIEIDDACVYGVVVRFVFPVSSTVK